MIRSRLCTVCALRLTVYGAAILVVRHTGPAEAAGRLAASLDLSTHDPTGLVLAVLLIGSLLEVLSGAARWR